jgi:Glyoxalase-like domain
LLVGSGKWLGPKSRCAGNEEVARLVGLGATIVSDERKPDGTGWVTLADPEGFQFRVERSAAERV